MKKTNVQKVAELLAKNPAWKREEIAKKLGLNIKYVYALVAKAKKEAQAESDLLFRASQGRAKLRGRPPMRMPTVAMFTTTKPLNRMIATNAKDDVNHPEHYTFGGIETIDYMEAKSTKEEFTGHLRLTALKYLSRANNKGDAVKDLKKAQWYLNKLVSTLEK